MGELRQYTIDNLSKMFQRSGADAATQVRASRLYDIPQWTVPGIHKLISRKALLSASDIEIIGPQCAAFVIKHQARIATTSRANAITNMRADRGCTCYGWEPVTMCVLCKDDVEKDAKKTLGVLQ
jgi:hypothetical protein